MTPGPNEAAIRDMLSASLEQIYTRAGHELAAGEFRAAELSDEEAEHRGRGWFERNRYAISSKICKSTTARLYREDPGRWDKVFLVAAFSDCLAGAFTGVAALTAAAFAVKVGLNELCRDH